MGHLWRDDLDDCGEGDQPVGMKTNRLSINYIVEQHGDLLREQSTSQLQVSKSKRFLEVDETSSEDVYTLRHM